MEDGSRQAHPEAWRPRATWWLLGAIAATFLLEILSLLVVRYGAPSLPGRPTGPVAALVAPQGLLLPDWLFVINTDWPQRPWTLVTSTLAHSWNNPLHIVFNAMFLWAMGPTVERIVGHRRFVALFLAGGAVSGVLQVELSHLLGDPSGALGASGALMVVFGILIVLLPRQEMQLVFPVPVRVPLWGAGVAYAALDVIGVFDRYDHIGNIAHLAGLAMGLAYGGWQRKSWARRGLRLTVGRAS